MKQLLILALASAMSLASYGQLSNTYITVVPKNNTTFEVVNNDPNCEVTVKVKSTNGFIDRQDVITTSKVYTVTAGLTIDVTVDRTCAGNVPNSQTNTVHIALANYSALPIKWAATPKAKFIDSRNIQVTFTIAEITNVKEVKIQVSPDAKAWRNVKILLPENLQPNVPYTLNVKL